MILIVNRDRCRHETHAYSDYWEERGRHSFFYKGEEFYTITPVPYYYKRRETLLRLIGPYFIDSRTKKLCDFGCGDGWYIRYFTETYPDKQYYGIDPSKSMITRAKEKNNDFFLANTSDPGIFNVMFDMVYAIAVFAHISSDEELMRIFNDIYRNINNLGYFIIFEQTSSYRLGGEEYLKRNQKEYTTFAEQCGFSLVKMFNLSYPVHRIFELTIARFFYKFLSKGKTIYEKKVYANKNPLFRALSALTIFLSGSPIKRKETTYGNTLFIFRKIERDKT